jgi:glycosyltransferase involved in cell wall biosynthesis
LKNVLVCPPGSACEARASALGIETRAVSMRNDLDGPAMLGIRRALVESGAEIAHLHTGRATWLGGWAARLAGVPAITTRRMDRDVARSLRTRLVHGALTRMSVAISPSIARSLEAAGVSKERIRLIQSAVEPAELAPSRDRATVRAGLGAKESDLVVLTLGALVRRKGIDVLLRAVAALDEPRPKVWIAGAGEEAQSLEALARELELADVARFLGRRSDAPDLLHACDVFAMPSRREGLGVAALEAMACARPIVASRIGGLGEAVVDGRTGLLVPPDDVAALAHALARLARDSDLRATLGRAGPARVAEGFLAEQMVASYAALYEEVLAQAALEPRSPSNRGSGA